MSEEPNHAAVPARDPEASARFLAGALGLRVDPPPAHFMPVTLSNRVSLDHDPADAFEPHHYAFMVGEEEFDAALAASGTTASPSTAVPGAGRSG
ncbi:VOC family protein [Streptomyces sp. VRA16 Mangrove soil]|uniref:VOC family protein n=1 Tax=Streptomyces sp. VRA16 Mangrove soil TaxID=2817434 RepID=UPI001A9E11F5|nr:VOC family protein [Streptomyces sp. VRA16 Mangrove soil]MBO1335646.1 VOC family protein [Streptomyces sp. VRA16 Mangrove soil]